MPFASLWLALVACEDVTVERPSSDEAIDVSAGWEQVREEAIKARQCYRGWKEYCVDDPAVVDRMIQAVLDRHFDGRMPDQPRDLAEVTQLVGAMYGRFARLDGRERVEDEIRAYYDDPFVEVVDGKGVSVRVGVPPGRLMALGDQITAESPLGMKSPFVRKGEWDTKEIARFLVRYLEAYPEEPAVRLQVLLPTSGAEVRRMDIRFYRDLDVVVLSDMDRPDRGWVSAPIAGDWAPYLEGRESLATSELRDCALERSGRPKCAAKSPR